MTGGTESALVHYGRFVEKIDGFCETVHNDLAQGMACRKGCDSCCRHLSLFTVEAVSLRLALDRLSAPVQQKIRSLAQALIDHPEGPCPLLDEGLCLVYANRPIICRTHGYPILVGDEGEKRVDYCPLNFKDSSVITRSHILDLDVLNTTLTAVNRLFLENDLGDPDFPERILMAEALLMDIGADETDA